MAYVKTYLPTLKTNVVNLKRDAKDLSRDLQRLEVRSKLGSKTLYWLRLAVGLDDWRQSPSTTFYEGLPAALNEMHFFIRKLSLIVFAMNPSQSLLFKT